MANARRPPPVSTPERLERHTDEPPTGRSNQTLQLYQTMLSRFDILTDAERTDLIELVSLFAEATSDDRQLLLALARRVSGAGR